MEEEKDDTPFVSYEVTSFLDKAFSISYLLSKDIHGSEAMKLGYIKGVQDVIDTLRACQKDNVGN